jgi:hypothetical protein
MRGAIPVTEAAGPKVDAIAVSAPPAAHGAERAAAETHRELNSLRIAALSSRGNGPIAGAQAGNCRL